jgi:hypothetical protein
MTFVGGRLNTARRNHKEGIMADEKKDTKADPKADAKTEAKAEEPAKPKRGEPTVTLTFVGAPYSGHLSIGHESFEVKDGKVEVPTRLVEVAGQAGFR